MTRACAQLVHFRKEDERLLRKLLSKVKAQADAVRHCARCRPVLALRARERLPPSANPLCKGDTLKRTEVVLPTQVDKSGADGHKDEEMTKLKARACDDSAACPRAGCQLSPVALRSPTCAALVYAARAWVTFPRGPLAYAARPWCTLSRGPLACAPRAWCTLSRGPLAYAAQAWVTLTWGPRARRRSCPSTT